MKKVKYYYSTQTQRIEPIKKIWWKTLLQWFGIICAWIVTAGLIVAFAFKYIGSPQEKKMKAELNTLQEKYDLLVNDIVQTQQKMTLLEERDNNVYREIFETQPLPDSVRNGNIVVNEKEFTSRLSPYSNEELIDRIEQKMNQLHNRIQKQATSYDTLQKYIENKQQMLQSIPSIQPVSNKQLTRIASGFGYRIDPIYKIGKFHAGLDFTAPQGTPIYATGTGTIETAEYNAGGYGNNIWINHGYGYRTHYAHLVKIKVREGQKITRGELIGWVGSTGKSTGPHCHYEIEKNGQKIDPIHFFYNDLKMDDYERLVKIAEQHNQAFD